jgi:phytoene synthase
MEVLYAFFRLTDDVSDAPGASDQKRAKLRRWREALAGMFQGHFTHPLHPALFLVIQDFRIPPEILVQAIDGVELDLEPVSIRTFPELKDYCYRVASTVGIACVHVWGFQHERAIEHATSAGIALQLTNILRDLKEDMAHQRIYIPEEDWKEFHCPPETWGTPTCNQKAFVELMHFQADRARTYYSDAMQLSPLLPSPGRAVFQVMMNIYQGLLNEIQHRGFSVFSGRVRVPRWTKISHLLQALPVRWGIP